MQTNYQYLMIYEPRCDKTCDQDFPPGYTQLQKLQMQNTVSWLISSPQRKKVVSDILAKIAFLH